jgi:exopolysaccharide production protein ExoY
VKGSSEVFAGLTRVDASISISAGPASNGQLEAPTFAANVIRTPLWKRVLDISCALTVAPLLLPLIVMISAIIKLGSRGPLLFKQERVGLLGKRFVLYKFRTMRVGTDTTIHETHVTNLIRSNEPMTKLDARGDARVIPFGRALRASGLDELPQLINILRGEMSFVGPRPCLPHEYEKQLPQQRDRVLTLPGLTGLWQVSGKNRTTFSEMVDLDLQYIRTRSLPLDLKIMLKTVPVMMAEVKNCYGPPPPPAPNNPEVTKANAQTTTG